MKKFFVVLVSLLIFSAALFAQYGPFGGEKRIEFSVMGGYGFASLNSAASYADSWSYGFLDSVNESTDFALLSKNSFALGANLAFYFSPNFGIQIGGAYFAPKPDLTADWAIDWNWFVGPTYSDGGSFATTQPQFSTIPLFVNFIGKYDMGQLGIFVSAGPTVFFNSVKADTASIYGDTAYNVAGYLQVIDYFAIPLTIDTTWTGFGFNVGGGFDFRFSPSIALTVEGRYYYCPSKELSFEWTTGTFDGLNGYLTNTYDNFDTAQSLTSTLKVNPSFFSVMGGLKFFF